MKQTRFQFLPHKKGTKITFINDNLLNGSFVVLHNPLNDLIKYRDAEISDRGEGETKSRANKPSQKRFQRSRTRGKKF